VSYATILFVALGFTYGLQFVLRVSKFYCIFHSVFLCFSSIKISTFILILYLNRNSPNTETYFFGVFFFFFYNEPELGAGINPGMALTPLPSSIGRGLNPRPSNREPSALPLDHSFR